MNTVNTDNAIDTSVNKLRLPNNKMPLIDNIVCLDYDKLYAELKIEFYERIIIKNYDFIHNILIYDKISYYDNSRIEVTKKIDEKHRFVFILCKEKNEGDKNVK